MVNMANLTFNILLIPHRLSGVGGIEPVFSEGLKLPVGKLLQVSSLMHTFVHVLVVNHSSPSITLLF